MPRRGGRGRWRLLILTSLALAGIVGRLDFERSRLAALSVERGTAAYERGEWDRAAALAGEGLGRAPRDRGALRLAARAAARLGRDAEARSLYDRLGGPSAMSAEDFYLLGTTYEGSAEHLKALECWQRGLGLDPGHPESLAGCARSCLRTKDLAGAARYAEELAARPGWEARGELLLGVAESERGDTASAAAALGRALARDPAAAAAPDQPSSFRHLLARALLRVGKPAEAVPSLKAILASGPDAEASWLLSRAFLQAGGLEEATLALQAAGAYRDQHATAYEPSPGVGAPRCAECHRAIYDAQQASLHARTFLRGRGLDRLPLPAAPVAEPGAPGVRYEITRDNGTVRFDARAKEETRRAVVEFAFGSGHHGVTLVGSDEGGQAHELRLSHYAGAVGWDVTAGQFGTPSVGQGILGRPLSAEDVHACLACHTTDPRSARGGTGPMGTDRGIGCERCHGPGGAHLDAIAAKFPDPAIARPRLATAGQVVALCAECHSPPGGRVAPSDPRSVRFPSAGLAWSRCYTEGGGALSCVTCHDPHRDAETRPAFYEARCLSCHAKATPSAAGRPPAETAKAASCPVNPGRDCLSCHMPKVKAPIPHTLFTDHFIRVRTASDPAAVGAPRPPEK
jgi:tetratricopeptide (TPR) repeat protein